MNTPDEPLWLTAAQVRRLHAESIRLFGGVAGLRDEGLLESALGRPRHLWTYEPDVSMPSLAAAYGFGLAKNHAFLDGNKRIALLSLRAFLFRNGYRFVPGVADTVTTFEGVASGAVSEKQLAAWIADHTAPR